MFWAGGMQLSQGLGAINADSISLKLRELGGLWHSSHLLILPVLSKLLLRPSSKQQVYIVCSRSFKPPQVHVTIASLVDPQLSQHSAKA